MGDKFSHVSTFLCINGQKSGETNGKKKYR